MWPYWFLFLFPAWMAISHLRPVAFQAGRWTGYWWIIFLLLVIMIGMRHEVGGDWYNDWEMVTGIRAPGAEVLLSDALQQKDWGYACLVWVVNELGFDIYTLDVLSAMPFTWGLVVFCRAQPRPWLAMAIAIPYLVIVVAMGYTRQSMAIGFSMLGLVALSRGSVLRFVLCLAVAGIFHMSAVILLPLALLAGTRRKGFTILWVTIAIFLLFTLILKESVDKLFLNYIGAEMESQGAGVRIAMNALPAVLFLWFRSRFVMPHSQSIFWGWMSWGALLFVVLLIVSPSSTAVDRVALYWIPLQLFVLSRLPDALGKPGGKNFVWVCAVVAYSGLIQLTWLFFAQTAFAWVPYQFYPWVWLWS